uniref:Uncharacterized protein n=1 Tax=Arundo donax TaxID=35708 RepID=A0A0A8ZRY9_ARUDO
MGQDIRHVRCKNSNSTIRYFLLSLDRFCHQHCWLIIRFVLNSEQFINNSHITYDFNWAYNLPTVKVGEILVRECPYITGGRSPVCFQNTSAMSIISQIIERCTHYRSNQDFMCFTFLGLRYS